MPPSESTRRAIYTEDDEVDDYIRSRRLERARRTLTADGFDVLSASAEFTWEMPRVTPRARIASSRSLLGERAGSRRRADRTLSVGELSRREGTEGALTEREVTRREVTRREVAHGEVAQGEVAQGEVAQGEIVELAGDHAWRAAAAARHAAPQAVEQSLDDWGARLADADLRPVQTPPAGLSVSPADEASLGQERGSVVAGGRRTVVITGRGADRLPATRRGYSAGLRPYERASFRPDRVAMWAVVLCVALVLVAAASH